MLTAQRINAKKFKKEMRRRHLAHVRRQEMAHRKKDGFFNDAHYQHDRGIRRKAIAARQQPFGSHNIRPLSFLGNLQ